MHDTPKDKDDGEDQERNAFEDLVGKLLKVPKVEVNELRKKLESEQAEDT